MAKCGNSCCTPLRVLKAAIVAFILLAFAFIAAGISVIVVFKVARRNNIKKVEDSLPAWETSDSPHSWWQFQQLTAYATLTPGNPQNLPSGNCSTITIRLDPYSCPYNTYKDEAARFQSVKQLAFCNTVPYDTFVNCDMRVSFHLAQGGANTTLATLPDLAAVAYKPMSIRMRDIRGPQQCSGKKQCGGSSFNACARKCSDEFGGMLNCRTYTCSATYTAISDLAVKVTSKSGTYVLDDAGPVISTGGAGANMLPKGFSWDWYPEPSGKGPRWQYDGLAFRGAPALLGLTLRSSADPWLTYMAVTGGSGYFEKPMTVLGGVLIGLGCALLIGAAIFVALLGTFRSVARRYSERPRGCCLGCLWKSGRDMFGPRPETAAPQPDLQVYPPGTAQPGGYPYTPEAAAASSPQTGMAAPAAAGGYYGYPPPVTGTPVYSQQQQQPVQQPYTAAYYQPPQQQLL